LQGDGGPLDCEAVAELYARHSRGICGYIRSIVRDPHEAEDITQQVFLKLITASDPAPTYFSAWLLRVARNAALDSLRRTKRTLVIDPQTWAPAGVAPDEETRRSLEEALALLSRGQRDVLLLRDVVGLTPHEAAELLGKSDGAVHMLHHRARRAVKAQLVERGSGPSTRGRGREAA
jgi:RNA polymerase sigma-70 factor (ECF subfamily)